MEKFKNTKILGVIGNVIMIVSLFCTWITVKAPSIGITQSAQFIEGTDGKWVLILSIFSLIIIFAENISPKFFKGLTNVKLTFIPSIIQLLIMLNTIYKANNLSIQMFQDSTEVTWSFQLGFYLMGIGVVLLLIFPILYKQDKNNK